MERKSQPEKKKEKIERRNSTGCKIMKLKKQRNFFCYPSFLLLQDITVKVIFNQNIGIIWLNMKWILVPAPLLRKQLRIISSYCHITSVYYLPHSLWLTVQLVTFRFTILWPARDALMHFLFMSQIYIYLYIILRRQINMLDHGPLGWHSME